MVRDDLLEMLEEIDCCRWSEDVRVNFVTVAVVVPDVFHAFYGSRHFHTRTHGDMIITWHCFQIFEKVLNEWICDGFPEFGQVLFSCGLVFLYFDHGLLCKF